MVNRHPLLSIQHPLEVSRYIPFPDISEPQEANWPNSKVSKTRGLPRGATVRRDRMMRSHGRLAAAEGVGGWTADCRLNDSMGLSRDKKLVGGFKDILFSPLLGEMIQFD